MGPFAVDIIKMPTELRETQIDQAGKPTLGIGQFMGNETPLSTTISAGDLDICCLILRVCYGKYVLAYPVRQRSAAV
jgi:hypothetical protein